MDKNINPLLTAVIIKKVSEKHPECTITEKNVSDVGQKWSSFDGGTYFGLTAEDKRSSSNEVTKKELNINHCDIFEELLKRIDVLEKTLVKQEPSPDKIENKKSIFFPLGGDNSYEFQYNGIIEIKKNAAYEEYIASVEEKIYRVVYFTCEGDRRVAIYDLSPTGLYSLVADEKIPSEEDEKEATQKARSLFASQNFRLYGWKERNNLTDTDHEIFLCKKTNGEKTEVGYWTDGASRHTDSAYWLMGIEQERFPNKIAEILCQISEQEDPM